MSENLGIVDCWDCGKPNISPGAECPHCGACALLQNHCKGCNKLIYYEAKFCPNCGATNPLHLSPRNERQVAAREKYIQKKKDELYGPTSATEVAKFGVGAIIFGLLSLAAPFAVLLIVIGLAKCIGSLGS